LTVSEVKRDARGTVVRFAGLEDRDQVGLLTGQVWFAERSVFPAASSDEVYVVDLLGLPVRTTDGVALGHLEDIRDFGGGEMLVIRDGAKERLVPNVDAFVERLDPAAGEVVIRPIEGLLEDL
jgi:16S rRNA processing protein RimM